MRVFIITTVICICFNLATTSAQEVNINNVAGKWEYESPKKKSKVLYNFALDNIFTSNTERNEKEIVVKGTYEVDKKNELNRLKLNIPSETDQTKTIINIYFIKFLGTDTLKAQLTTDKAEKWLTENRKNTMTLIRKKDKAKE
jgi:uncharacterized protein (TIGR03066 family)